MSGVKAIADTCLLGWHLERPAAFSNRPLAGYSEAGNAPSTRLEWNKCLLNHENQGLIQDWGFLWSGWGMWVFNGSL